MIPELSVPRCPECGRPLIADQPVAYPRRWACLNERAHGRANVPLYFSVAQLRGPR